MSSVSVPRATGLIVPDWPAPETVKACITSRYAPYESTAVEFDGSFSDDKGFAAFNLALHVGDHAARVQQNRQALRAMYGWSQEPAWLQQVHGAVVLNAEVLGTEALGAEELDAESGMAPGAMAAPPEADGTFATVLELPCVVMTADCLPILLCNRQGSWVAALHGGWRGLASGIIAQGVTAYSGKPDDLLAYLGPAISAANYEVGEEVRSAMQAALPDLTLDRYFEATRPGHYHCDLYGLARALLKAVGVEAVYGGDFCTFAESRFYSYRRQGACSGRQASLIWLQTAQ